MVPLNCKTYAITEKVVCILNMHHVFIFMSDVNMYNASRKVRQTV